MPIENPINCASSLGLLGSVWDGWGKVCGTGEEKCVGRVRKRTQEVTGIRNHRSQEEVTESHRKEKSQVIGRSHRRSQEGEVTKKSQERKVAESHRKEKSWEVTGRRAVRAQGCRSCERGCGELADCAGYSGWLAWLACYAGWLADYAGDSGWLAWLACYAGWLAGCAGFSGWLAWLACYAGWLAVLVILAGWPSWCVFERCIGCGAFAGRSIVSLPQHLQQRQCWAEHRAPAATSATAPTAA
eukprot:8228-Chlamydomonas_euryale.AAC.2